MNEQENPTPEAPDVAQHGGGDRPAGDVDPHNAATPDELPPLRDGAIVNNGQTRENLRLS